MPVYKVEQFIRKCIDSIISQTYSNWLLFLVDDGSPDNCGAICDSYPVSDNRIKVIHKKWGINRKNNACAFINTMIEKGFDINRNVSKLEDMYSN